MSEETTQQQDITQYQQQEQQQERVINPNAIVLVHLPDADKEVVIGEYEARFARITIDTQSSNKTHPYKLSIIDTGNNEHSFKAVNILIEFRDKVVFRLTR